MRLFTLDVTRQTHTPLDPLRTSGLQAFFMFMTWSSFQHVRANCKLCCMSASNGVFEIVCKLIQKKQIIMAFFETPALFRTPGGQHQPGPNMPPFHVCSPFPTSDPRSYPIHEVFQFEYLGLILDPKLTMHLAMLKPYDVLPRVRPCLGCFSLALI